MAAVRFVVTPAKMAPASASSSPEPSSRSSSRPAGSSRDSGPDSTRSDDASEGPDTPRPDMAADGDSDTASCDKNLALFEEELATRPKVSALLRRVAAYSTLPPPDAEGQPGGRGTVRGVLLPCLQDVFGLLLFLRLGWVVGAAGLLQALGAGLLCCACTLLTAVSLSAIVTNGGVMAEDPGVREEPRHPEGGALALLARALGPEVGGAAGLCCYLGTAFAAAMAALGAAETLLVYVAPQAAVFAGPGAPARLNNGRLYGSAFLALLVLAAALAPRPARRLAPLGLAALLLGLLALLAGAAKSAVAPPGLRVCLLGNRTLAAVEACAKTEGGPGLLRGLFCRGPRCDPYYSRNNATALPAVPGLASGVLAENLWPRYGAPGERLEKAAAPSVPAPGGLGSAYVRGQGGSFGLVLGLVFPLAPGLMAAVAPAPLANPPRSVPAGTFGAVAVAALIYGGSAALLGACVEGVVLRDKFGAALRGTPAVGTLAWPSPAVAVLGAAVASLGAGLRCLVTGPGLLRALARLRALPGLHVLAPGEDGREPVWALGLTAAIAELGVLVASLDLVAPIFSVFLLTCYLAVNLACALQSLLRTPTWRPRLPYYHWGLSLAGAGLCLVLMFAASWSCAAIALGIAGTVYKYMEYQGAEKEWGDGLRGLSLSAAHFALLRLEETPQYSKNWRPQLLVLLKLDEELRVKQPWLLSVAAQLKAGGGLTVVASVIPGDFLEAHEQARTAEQELRRRMAAAGLRGFAQALVAPRAAEGLAQLVQGCGLGALRPNALLLGWPRGWRRRGGDPRPARTFVGLVRAAAAAGRALLVAKGCGAWPGEGGLETAAAGPAPPEPAAAATAGGLETAAAAARRRAEGDGDDGGHDGGGSLDVWWVVHDGGVLTLLPCLLRQHKAWRGCRVRIFTVAQLEDNSIEMRRHLRAFVRLLRLPAAVEVVEMHDSDISAYTYERTLMMEQRSAMLRQMRLSEAERQREAQLVKERSWRPRLSSAGSEDEEDTEATRVHLTWSRPRRGQPGPDLLGPRPGARNVRRMHTAVRLNEAMVARSQGARLVLLNLPPPPRRPRAHDNYLEFVEVLTEGLERVLLVRGAGTEVITLYP
ncbi:solute carrier family 12 member 6-like [Apteryx mantelli]|uniref:Solute carrier family 12 member 6-like n=1 Tax=Apteryx mantelli TaxID=2696672 RepID=A0ABM4G1I3_9AVES